MGADLYIESLHDKCHETHRPLFEAAVQARDTLAVKASPEFAEKLQALVSYHYDQMYAEGYFRDSYNDTSLFWQLKLSWWGDGATYIGEDGYMSVEKTKELLAEVKNREMPPFEEWRVPKRVTLDEDEHTPQKWYEYFVDKRERFIEFLEQAIELDEPICCSV